MWQSYRRFSWVKGFVRATGIAALAIGSPCIVATHAAPSVSAGDVTAGQPGSITEDIRLAPDGKSLAHRLEVLAWDAPLRVFPMNSEPAPQVFVDYFKKNYPAGFDVRPYWRAHRGDWRSAMRESIAAAMRTPLTDAQLRHAVALFPLFLTQDDMAKLNDRPLVARSMALELSGAKDSAFSAEIYRRGMRAWTVALWNKGTEPQRIDLVRSMMDATRPAANAPAGSGFFKRQNETLPLTHWLAARPAELATLLADPDRKVSQRLLALVLSGESAAKLEAIQTEAAPALTPALIGALQGPAAGEADNYKPALRLLQLRAADLRPALHQAFLASLDWRQKTSLAELLVPGVRDAKADAATTATLQARQDLLMFSYRLLATVKAEGFPQQMDPCWPGTSGQLAWAGRQLMALGEPAQAFLTDRLTETLDPRQAALSLLVLDKMKGIKDRTWDERLMRLLAFGIDAGATEDQRQFCEAALALSPPPVQERTRQIAAQPANPTQLVVRDGVKSRAEDHITAFNMLLMDGPRSER